MLYKKNSSPSLSPALFENPTSEYRGTPFWSWNTKLNPGILGRQIEYLKEMGFGGFHMHSRTGMATNYLSDEFMDLVKFCVEKAEQEDMLAWLYDEDRWASGAAGGLVTKTPKYRQKTLLFTPNRLDGALPQAEAMEAGKPYLLACYDVRLNADGTLQHYARKSTDGQWYAYCVTHPGGDPWFNNQSYVDTLMPEAIEKFIEITHEAYAKAVGDRFSKSVPAIFTDEPQFARKSTLAFAEDKTDISLPWTYDFPETYQAAYGSDLLDALPELFWELPDGAVSTARYHYHDHITERFTQAFADQCGDWCQAHDFCLTGHMMEEPTLESQTAALGEAMRAYRGFQLPGIDMLCDRVELTTAKQAQSASHQYGREGVLSELYGVTNWNFDFRGHKFQGDWQAALGVTVRVPHLSWVSMAGEAKRDYPASINYQSPWYKEYPYVEDHFARLNTALTRGKPLVKIGVVHPVESYWLHWGPSANTGSIREDMEQNFENITKWLLFGQADFDFLSESLLPSLCPKAGNPLQVGEMAYDTILVPNCETLRKSTLDILSAFRAAGGNLIFVGACPKYLDAQPSGLPEKLYAASKQVPIARAALLDALQEEKLLEIRNANGMLSDNLLYQLRQDGGCRWLFIARGVKQENPDITAAQKIRIKLKGCWRVEQYDTISGKIASLPCRAESEATIIDTELYGYDSLLLRLVADKAAEAPRPAASRTPAKIIDFKQKVSYRRDEPNVLLLDLARYAFDGGEFHPEEEVLRADDAFRRELGYPLRMSAVAQPWVVAEEPVSHYLTLEFRFQSEITVPHPVLAAEDAASLEISLNGVPVEPIVTGYYVDESIGTVSLPQIEPGENLLTLKIPFGRRTSVEACYLLGDFNVRLEGCEKTLVPATSQIGFSDITSQGLPFYGGNVIYSTEIETGACDLRIHATKFRGSLVRVEVDGTTAGIIAYSPYIVEACGLAPGKHTITFKLFGNRYNTFAGLHNAHAKTTPWAGPDFWRTKGDAWCYEYQLDETGLLKSPVIEVFEK